VPVLWDVDYTLINAGGSSTQLYGMVFRQLFGRELGEVAPMAGRTDRAIVLHTLERAGVSDPYRHVEAFLAGLAGQAPEFRALVVERGHALPGAAAALAALGSLGPANAVQSVVTGNIRPLAEAKLGASSVADLAAADPDALLPDLTDTGAVLAAVLGGPR
jgi:phosphoglycolate phosphatase